MTGDDDSLAELRQVLAAVEQEQSEVLRRGAEAVIAAKSRLDRLQAASAALLAVEQSEPSAYSGNIASAIRLVLQSEDRAFSAADVRKALDQVGYRGTHRNKNATIHAVLRRMATSPAKEVRRHDGPDGPRYRWIGARIAASPKLTTTSDDLLARIKNFPVVQLTTTVQHSDPLRPDPLAATAKALKILNGAASLVLKASDIYVSIRQNNSIPEEIDREINAWFVGMANASDRVAGKLVSEVREWSEIRELIQPIIDNLAPILAMSQVLEVGARTGWREFLLAADRMVDQAIAQGAPLVGDKDGKVETT